MTSEKHEISEKTMKFLGFQRPDGTVGVRNHVVIIPSVYCANEPAKLIANRVEGAVALTHPFGCDEPGPEPYYHGQVIHNLVINTQQAMPQGGKCHILAENVSLTTGQVPQLEKGKYVKISVRDKGVGIPREHLDKIFDPYFTTKQKGSGLGLATSYSIVKNHGGLITVESKAGAGSTFHVYLPASKKIISKKKVREEKPVAGKGKILVMDDEDVVRTVASRMLQHIGYKEVECAKDGAAAIKLYQKAMESGKPFTAVIMDLTIPGGMGGKEAIEKLLKIDPKVKAIVSSGYSSDPIMSEYREYGFSGVIAKPYTLDGLSRALHEVISSS